MGAIKKRIQDNKTIRKNLRRLGEQKREIKSNHKYKETLLCQLKNQDSGAKFIHLYKSQKYAIMFIGLINNLKALWEKEIKKDNL